MQQTNWKFALGTKVKCQLTGFTGVIAGRAEWLNGCIQYSVQPKVDKDGKHPSSYWMDEEQLVAVKGAKKVHVQPRPSGGPSKRSPSTNNPNPHPRSVF